MQVGIDTSLKKYMHSYLTASKHLHVCKQII